MRESSDHYHLNKFHVDDFVHFLTNILTCGLLICNVFSSKGYALFARVSMLIINK